MTTSPVTPQMLFPDIPDARVHHLLVLRGGSRPLASWSQQAVECRIVGLVAPQVARGIPRLCAHSAKALRNRSIEGAEREWSVTTVGGPIRSLPALGRPVRRQVTVIVASSLVTLAS